MDIYSAALSGLIKILKDAGLPDSAAVIGTCLEKWEKFGKCDQLQRELLPGGRLETLRIGKDRISDPVKGFWTGQLFQALVALSAQVADFHGRGMKTEIDFLRKNFGTNDEFMEVGMCARCKRREATALDIDQYVSKRIITKRIVDGLENGNLDEEIEHIMKLELPELERERRRLRLRLSNTGLPINDRFGRLVSCMSCGSEEIVPSKLLKSIKENVFILLNN